MTRNIFESFNGNLSDYYMVSYHYEKDDFIQWVRSPFLHKNEINEILLSRIVFSDGNITDLRILSEEWLSEMRKGDWDPETELYKEDTITNREYIYGSKYENTAQKIVSGVYRSQSGKSLVK